MTFIAVQCPHCQSEQVVKRGKTRRGTQRYLCQNTAWGIHVRWDSWVSVRYAERLNSAKSSVTLQSTDRHGILGEKSTDFQVG
jgi:InsA N-terminal domain